MSGLLPSIILPSDLRAKANRLKAAAIGTDETVSSCAALDSATRAAWGAFYLSVTDYVNTDFGLFNTTGSVWEQGESLERELYEWQKKLATTCPLKTPLYDPKQPPPPALDLLKIVAVSAGVVAGAYGVSKLVEIIPKWRSSRGGGTSTPETRSARRRELAKKKAGERRRRRYR